MIKDLLYAPDSPNVLLFHAINNIQAPCFQQLAYISSAIGKYTLFPLDLAVIALFMWIYGNRIKTTGNYTPYIKEAKQVIICLVISYIVYLLWVGGLKHFLHMPRPFAILPEGTIFVKDSVKAAEPPFVSIPSGHASFNMMMLVVLWPLLNKFGKAAGTFWVLWIGIARIALGVHFPFDIAISFCMSFAITALTTLSIKKYYHK